MYIYAVLVTAVIASTGSVLIRRSRRKSDSESFSAPMHVLALTFDCLDCTRLLIVVYLKCTHEYYLSTTSQIKVTCAKSAISTVTNSLLFRRSGTVLRLIPYAIPCAFYFLRMEYATYLNDNYSQKKVSVYLKLVSSTS